MQKKMVLPYAIIITLLVTLANAGVVVSSSDIPLNALPYTFYLPLVFNNTGQDAPTITSHPANQTVNVGQIAAFNVVAHGTAPLNYQWQRKESGGDTWSNVGSNSASVLLYDNPGRQ